MARGREARGGGRRGGFGGGGGGGGPPGPQIAAAAAAQSLRNQAEADLAAALFCALQEELAKAEAAGEGGGAPQGRRPITVGVLTPYRRQVESLRATFSAVAGPAAAAGVRIETVDAFQGKEVDVAILSCVRARGGAGPEAGAPPPPAGAGLPPTLPPPVAGDAALHRSVGFVADVRRLNVAITRARRALWILGSATTLAASPVWAALIQDAAARGCVVWDTSADALFPHGYGARRRFVPPPPPPVLMLPAPPPRPVLMPPPPGYEQPGRAGGRPYGGAAGPY